MSDVIVHDESTPLLHKKQCNGDEQIVSHSEDLERDQVENIESNTPTPLPLRAVAVIMLLRATTPLAFQIIFPFVNQMILEVGIVDNPEEVGFYSGLIESVFSFLSLATVMPISYLADYIGRKPIILWGTLAMGLSTACFGMSKTLLAMILTRCMSGATGSVWVATKTVIAEYTDKTNQVKAFQLLTISFRIGQIVALPLGGLLAHPDRNLPFPFFKSKFWIENPFALPCFVSAATAIVSVILGYFLLDETLKSKREQSVNVNTNSSDIDISVTDDTSLKEILTPQVVGLLLNNIIMAFVAEVIFALFTLFSFTPISSGGLGLSEASIGLQMSIRAFLHIGLMILYSTFERYFKGTVRTYRVTMFSWLIVVCCMPGLNILARLFGAHSLQVNLAMFVFFIVWGFAGFSWTSATIMVTDASPSEKALSRINGLSQMAVILPQAIAPATATSFFAYSVKSQIAGGYLIWIVLFGITFVGAIHSLTLKESVNSWRAQPARI